MSRKLFLTPAELSLRWGGSICTRNLANWRTTGKGARYVKIGGRVAYSVAAVEDWEQSRSVQSTSEYEGIDYQGA